VLATIQLNDYLTLRTTKISYEGTDGMLPAKLSTAELSIAKLRPESLLGVGLIATQLARFDPNAFHASALTWVNSLTLSLSLLEGEGINPEHTDPLLSEIHLPLHLNSRVPFQISRLSASSSPSPFTGRGQG
jgi:hypothetical protein